MVNINIDTKLFNLYNCHRKRVGEDMKNNKNIKIVLIIIAMLVVTIGLIIYIPKSNLINKIIENNALDYYLCEGIRCKNKSLTYENKETTVNCEVCNRELKFSTSSVDKLCEKCSKSTKRCKHCGEKITDEKIAENNRKKVQLAKYNKINIAENKICSIDKNNIAILTKDYLNKESNNSILIIYDMLENKEIKRIDLKDDYIIKGPEITFDILTEVERGMNLETAQKIYKEQENEKKEYEARGRLFCIDNKIILITPDEKSNFIYNIEKDELQPNLKSNTANFGDENYYYIKDEKSEKTYYYFEKYDLYTENIENLELEKYVVDSSEFEIENLESPDIKVIENGEKYMISYYEEKYGKTKIKILDKNKSEIDTKKISEENVVFESKNRIAIYNTKTNEEIWCYDKKLNDEIYEEIMGF